MLTLARSGKVVPFGAPGITWGGERGGFLVNGEEDAICVSRDEVSTRWGERQGGTDLEWRYDAAHFQRLCQSALVH